VKLSVLVVLLGAFSAIAEEARPLRIAVPGLRGVRVSEQELELYADTLAQNLRAPGVEVVTAREISTLLGIERQKQLLGCVDGATSCMAELANALGADGVMLGTVARIDDAYQLTFELISPRDAAMIAQGTRRVGTQVASIDATVALARELGRNLLLKKGRPVPPQFAVSARGPAGVSWVPVGLGVAAAGTGIVLLSLAEADAASLRASGAQPLNDGAATRDQGKTFQAAGAVCLGVGLAATAAGLGLVLFGPRAPETSVALVPLRDGAAFAVSGVLP